MSLLMQALKKAERAKQNSVPEEELDKPSEAFDDVLALTPEPAPLPAPAALSASGSAPTQPTQPMQPTPPVSPTSSAPPIASSVAASSREFSLEPMDGLSLEPLPPPVAAATTPRPSPSPLPAASDHKEPGLTMDLAVDPVVARPAAIPASAPAARAAAASATATAASSADHARYVTSADAAAGATAAATLGAAAAASASAPRAPITAAPAAAQARVAADASHSAQTSAGGRSAGNKPAGRTAQADTAAQPRAGAAARARARTAGTAEPSGIDPERLRLIGLIALLVLLLGGFGIYYWRALTAPGAGANLPPVPMPPAGATGASPGPGQVVIANAGPGGADAIAGGPDGGPGASDTDPLLAPASSSRASQQELERRVARTEQELAAAQQAIQAAATPRAEQMPVLAAPANNDIRVTRLVQPAPVSPTLDNAYQAFNSGDTAGAQQQYDAALAQDANNRDALLGAAIVAARQNQKDKAAAYYLRLLELSPNDADATAGLIGLRQGDISQSEARLKTILAANPDAAPLLFALGNLYAQQGRWSDAQQAYFRAVGAAPDNPDYAYNLAIGLDRLNQGKLALGYYQRALALAQDKAVGFDRNALRKRMHELTTAAH